MQSNCDDQSCLHLCSHGLLTNDCVLVCFKLPGQTQTINSLIQTMRASGLDIQDEEGLLCTLTVYIYSLSRQFWSRQLSFQAHPIRAPNYT